MRARIARMRGTTRTPGDGHACSSRLAASARHRGTARPGVSHRRNASRARDQTCRAVGSSSAALTRVGLDKFLAARGNSRELSRAATALRAHSSTHTIWRFLMRTSMIAVTCATAWLVACGGDGGGHGTSPMPTPDSLVTSATVAATPAIQFTPALPSPRRRRDRRIRLRRRRAQRVLRHTTRPMPRRTSRRRVRIRASSERSRRRGVTCTTATFTRG